MVTSSFGSAVEEHFITKNQHLRQIKIILGLVPVDLLMWLPVSAIDVKPDVFL